MQGDKLVRVAEAGNLVEVKNCLAAKVDADYLNQVRYRHLLSTF